MSGVKDDRRQFTPQVSLEIGSLIDQRAELAFNDSRAAVVAAIIEKWFADGCPPLSPAEEGLKVMGKLPGWRDQPAQQRHKKSA